MLTAPFRVVLDANVLYPFTLRDTLLRASAKGLFQAYWSAEILDEVVRNLLLNRVANEEGARHLVEQMTESFPEALVSDYEYLVDSMRTDPKDRHVAAAAVVAGAQVIVTSNLRDFRDLPEGIEAQPPDEFLCDLLDLDPETMIALLEEQAAALKRPPKTFQELLDGLAKTVPKFVEEVRAREPPP